MRCSMDFIQRSIEMKWPILLLELIFLIGGIMLIAGGIKIMKQSKASGITGIVLGTIIVLVCLYLLFWTLIFGYNS